MLGEIGDRTRRGGAWRRGNGRLKAGRHRRCDADVAGDPHPQAGAFDLDLGETGLVKQQREFADERTVVALEFCFWFVVRLARHELDPKVSVG